MEILNKNKFFFSTLFFLVLIISIGIGMVIVNAVNLCELRNRFLGLKSELQTLLCHAPSPVRKNVVITTSNLEQLYKMRNEWYNTIGMGQFSETPIECYWNIQKEVEFIKTQAKAANIIINPKCDFGFFQYLIGERLPGRDSLRDLDFQCQIIKMLSKVLIESSPKEILNLVREPVVGEIELDDSFKNDAVYHSRRVYDIFYSKWFKLSFTGTTQVLRLFINKIESMQIPLLIRNIQVANQTDGNSSLVATEGLAVFSITLELLDFKVVRM